jgi:hypothetical protein
LLGNNPGDKFAPATDAGFVEHRLEVLLKRSAVKSTA